MAKQFSFSYPLKHKVVRDLKIVTETVGDLEVEAVGKFNKGETDVWERYQVDIDTVKWQGVDVQPILVVLGGMDEVEEAAVRYFSEIAND